VTRVSEISTTSVITVDPGDSLRDAVEAFRAREVPSAYFVDYWSDIGGDLTSHFNSLEGPEWDVLDSHSVAEVMTRTVIGIPSDAGIQEAAQRGHRPT